MGNLKEQIWVNMEAGLMYESSFRIGTDRIEGCVGKKVVIEAMEFDTVRIEDNYYIVVGNLHGLDLLELIVTDPDKDLFLREKKLKEAMELVSKEIDSEDCLYLDVCREEVMKLTCKMLVRVQGVDEANILLQGLKAGDIMEDIYPTFFMEALKDELKGGK